MIVLGQFRQHNLILGLTSSDSAVDVFLHILVLCVDIQVARILELLFNQIERTRCDHQVDCTRDGFEFSD